MQGQESSNRLGVSQGAAVADNISNGRTHIDLFGLSKNFVRHLQDVGVQSDLAAKFRNDPAWIFFLHLTRQMGLRHPGGVITQLIGKADLIEEMTKHLLFAGKKPVHFGLTNRKKKIEFHRAPKNSEHNADALFRSRIARASRLAHSAEMALKKLFWIDMEMTGLDVQKEVIIEVAAIITDLDFKPLETYEVVVNQPQTYLDRMDDWNKDHHTKSGLVAKIPRGKPLHEVEEELIRLVNKHWPKIEKKEDKVILAGNSIMQDRLFIDKYMPKFASLLHYRILDVSSWKIIFNNKYNLKHEKTNSHRALTDIQESIDELKFYLSKLH